MCEFSTLNLASLQKLHRAPRKDSTISFSVRLVVNNNSDPTRGISASEVPSSGIAVTFAPRRYPKLQSFKAAYHSKYQKKVLLVGGRSAGLHLFDAPKGPYGSFNPRDQNFSLFVLDLDTNVTTAAALPPQLKESLGTMNAQSKQVMKSGKNYLYYVGGFGWSFSKNTNLTQSTLSVISVDEVIDSIEAAAKSKTIPEVSKFVLQASHDSLMVTGGEMLFVPENATGVDTFHLIVGQNFIGNYNKDEDKFKYTRSVQMFPVPYPNKSGILPAIEVTTLNAFNCSSGAHIKSSLDAQLARRDLNVVPTFLPETCDGKTARPGALILSGVFQQDGSNAPFLQPIIFSFSKDEIPPSKGQKGTIKTFAVKSFFQLFNNYNCANIQLFSANDKAIYNVLLGGVSYFCSDAGVTEQVSSLFSAPFTTDVSIVKQDNDGNFTQILCHKSEEFFDTTKLTTFGTEAIFIPDKGVPINHINLSEDILDLDSIRAADKRSVRLGSIFGGIESTTPGSGCPPSFKPEMTDASSRLIDVYLDIL